ncbi:MAG: DUF3750 domain-containing protein [Candidatus Campbellbacteria bacterium]|nr:DUF3750 domain-containing protein [Candidatus Campbellbacteria bacterium]
MKKIIKKILKGILYLFLFLIVLLSILIIWDFTGWDKASRESSGIAPDPKETRDAVIQIYAAELWGWRGLFADHTWISTKQRGAEQYTVYEVIGWLTSEGYDSVLRIEKDLPDRFWYGATPRVLVSLQGGVAEELVEKIHNEATNYPYKTDYSTLPGPNSNTFIAWISCRIPELDLELSQRAIGKNYLEKRGCDL